MKFGLALAFGLFAMINAAMAEDAYPSRPITLIVPFAPGSSTDIFTRHLAERLKDFAPQSVLVEALPGANGIIGTGQAMNRKADGYTVLIGTISTQVANYSLYKAVPYQASDFKGIGCLYRVSPLVAIRSTLPIKSIPELIEYGKQNPGKLTYGWSNSTTKIGGEILSSRTKTPIRNIPYKGSPQIMTDMLGERVDVYVDSPPPILPHLKDGTMRVLATTAPKRPSALPDVPTLIELGFPDAVMDPWVAAFVKSDTPDATVKQIEAIFDKVTSSAEFKSDLAKLGLESWRCSGAELDKTVNEDIPVWEKLIASAGIEKQ